MAIGPWPSTLEQINLPLSIHFSSYRSDACTACQSPQRGAKPGRLRQGLSTTTLRALRHRRGGRAKLIVKLRYTDSTYYTSHVLTAPGGRS